MSALLDLAIRATVLLALAGIAAALLGRAGASAAMRHAAWACGIGGLLALPLLSMVLPALEILPAAQSAPAPVEAAVSAAQPAAAAEAVHWGWFGWGAYAAIVILLLVRILIGRVRLARLWRASNNADFALQAEVDGLARVAGIRRRVSLKVADGPVMPMTWGTVAPKVLLPSDVVLWSAERRRFVLLHELAHIARCDSFGTLATSLACALYWFHPAVWLAAARLRAEQEHAADDLVLSAGAPAVPYARDLLALAAPASLPSLAMARLSQLEQRLTAIVAPRRRRRSGPAFVLASGLVALGSTMLVAAAAPRSAPLAPTPPAPPMAAAAPSALTAPAPPNIPAAPGAPAAPRATRVAAAVIPGAASPAPASAPHALALPAPPAAPSPPAPVPPIPRIPAIAPIPPIPPMPGAAAPPPVPAIPATATTPGTPGLPGLPGIAGMAGK